MLFNLSDHRAPYAFDAVTDVDLFLSSPLPLFPFPPVSAHHDTQTTRVLAEEQFMKRALVEKIVRGLPMGMSLG